jgi:oligoribonuclease
MSTTKKKKPMIWLDLEMTGLNPDRDGILEIALIITDQHLNIMEEGPDLVIGQKPETFDMMDDWNQKQHTSSGLWAKALTSQMTTLEAEELVLGFLQKFVKPKKGVLVGNSIWQDRRFIIKHMPRLDEFLDYRMIDVSAFKSLSKYWYKGLHFKKAKNHRAMDDIKESIGELAYYGRKMFLNAPLGEG